MEKEDLTDQLPEGWHLSNSEESARYIELQKEIPPGHLLKNVPVRVVAHRDGTDDILCQHIDDIERFTVVHLSWIMKEEINQNYPTIEVDGNFNDFLKYENQFQ